MEFFRFKRDIPFMRHALVFNIISFVTFALAVFFIVTRGLHLSIEFTGGTVVEVAYPQSSDIGKIRATVDSLGFGEVQVQQFGSSRDVIIRLPLRGDVKQADVVASVFGGLCKSEGGTVTVQSVTTDKGEALTKPVCGTIGKEPVMLQRSEFVGPQVGSELARDGALALGVTIIGIMIYLAIRFEWKYA
ncbi:MAG: protein translocase subunit SecF, partial [Rhizobacter sp.]|nr:protein translocase subunit SecF [Rhizobacter sp.]